jgi:hypothetical protein
VEAKAERKKVSKYFLQVLQLAGNVMNTLIDLFQLLNVFLNKALSLCNDNRR